MNRIVVNGRSISVSGNNISIINNKVIVDGKVVEEGLSGVVDVKFEGNLASLRSDSGVTVNGDVLGNVDAGGSVDCGNINGYVDAGGSVRCGNVGGDIDAGGSVRYQK